MPCVCRVCAVRAVYVCVCVCVCRVAWITGDLGQGAAELEVPQARVQLLGDPLHCDVGQAIAPVHHQFTQLTARPRPLGCSGAKR